MRHFHLSLLIVLTLLCCVSCDTVKDSLGLSHNTPDEFQVPDTQPLVIPPNYDIMPLSSVKKKSETMETQGKSTQQQALLLIEKSPS